VVRVTVNTLMAPKYGEELLVKFKNENKYIEKEGIEMIKLKKDKGAFHLIFSFFLQSLFVCSLNGTNATKPVMTLILSLNFNFNKIGNI
jgi:hypothetical protein